MENVQINKKELLVYYREEKEMKIDDILTLNIEYISWSMLMIIYPTVS